MTALLATTAAAFFGLADFLGGVASRRSTAERVTAISQAVGLPALAVALALTSSAPPSASDQWLGVVAGLSGGIGVVALYAALASGRMSVVAPVTAAVAGSLPVVIDVARGSAISAVNGAGIVLAIAAVIMVSLPARGADVEEAAERVDDARVSTVERAALMLALLSGVGFAGSYLAYSFTDPASGLWPLASARTTSAMLLCGLALVRTRGLVLGRDALAPAVWAGLLDMTANFALITALHLGPLAIAAVLASLYPVFTVLLARVVLREHLGGLQRVGVIAALVAVVLAAVP